MPIRQHSDNMTLIWYGGSVNIEDKEPGWQVSYNIYSGCKVELLLIFKRKHTNTQQYFTEQIIKILAK